MLMSHQRMLTAMSDVRRRDQALERVRGAVDDLHRAEATRDTAVARALHWGATWVQIGAALGVTAQSAHRRFRTLRYDPKSGKTWHEPPLPL